MKTIVKISGMGCEHCVKKVTKILNENFDVSDVSVEIGKAEVSSHVPLDHNKVKELIEDAGFDLLSIEEA